MNKEIKGYPHKQPFNIKGKECKSKKNTRWNPNAIAQGREHSERPAGAAG